ncbi:GNAT family N-acetyltransferase [Marinospirillum perlucidum]|uniref:GNAT family N-acetyltransferase n=1 Tax=Marinospirillum perlucidum TaxID=1982602 RepID=UPI000DF1F75E|nr:GNAT family N-acetyltransferase [Marinospirillum perlucidum]
MSETSADKKSLRLTARQGSWEQLGSWCRQVRHKVFVEEQQIPEEEEWDAQDPLSTHYLLLLNDRPAATARLTPDGKVGRFAVLAQLRRKKLGLRLMQRIEEDARRQGLKKLELNAQTEVADFYRHLGYRVSGEEYLEVGIPHLPMSKSLVADLQKDSSLTREELLEALQTTQEVRLQGREQIQLAVELLIHQAARSLRMETPEFMQRWFASEAFTPLLSLAKRHAHSRVEFLLGETRQFSRQSSPLLNLHQRAPSHIEIRRAHSLYRPSQQAYLLVDDKHLLWWPHYQEPRVELFTADHREAYRQSQKFKLHWQKGEVVKHLQSNHL